MYEAILTEPEAAITLRHRVVEAQDLPFEALEADALAAEAEEVAEVVVAADKEQLNETLNSMPIYHF